MRKMKPNRAKKAMVTEPLAAEKAGTLNRETSSIGSAAGMGPPDISCVSAHATATVRGDLAENEALKKAFGGALSDICVTALKSSYGHTIGASGAVAAAVAAMSVRDQAVPPTRNLDHLDPAIDLDVVRGTPRPLPAGAAVLVNAAGFGGHNTALIIAGE
jgi:3-oxoacyl-[acyl-carrier-protein] synthase II